MKLTPELLVGAYRQGLFPMADEFDEIHWYHPDPRAILPLDGFHVPRSLQRVVNSDRFEVRRNTAFRDVMAGCAAPEAGRESTWINPEIAAVYAELHDLGFAHSVETWLDGELVGGLYGVAQGGLFAGESMFSLRRDASKVALVHLVNHLRERGFQLLDIQFITPHLTRFGAEEIPAADYQRRLEAALLAPATW